MPMTKALVALSRLAILLVVLACDSAGPEFTQLKFDGRVTDAATGAAIAGATVAIVHYPDGPFQLVGTTLQFTPTDSDGRYSLLHVGCGRTPYVQVFAPSYHLTDEAVRCMAAEQVLDFQLVRAP